MKPKGNNSGSESGGKRRLQRVMADAGVAARRVCESMIEEGRVRVNGRIVKRLPVFVELGDKVEVDGRPLKAEARPLYVMLHKPERTLVTAADEPGMERATVLDLVDHPAAERLFPVGRLDFDTTGLVLLTNDGELANRLTHPRYGVTKTYQVTVRGDLDHAAVQAIREKAHLAASRDDQEQGKIRPGGADVAPGLEVMKREPGRTTLLVTLREARNRQLRDILSHLGMPVKKLTRTAIGPVQLKGLAVGRWRELTRDELKDLRAAARGAPTRQTPQTSPRRNDRGPSGAGRDRPTGLRPRQASRPTTPSASRPPTRSALNGPNPLRSGRPQSQMPRKPIPGPSGGQGNRGADRPVRSGPPGRTRRRTP